MHLKNQSIAFKLVEWISLCICSLYQHCLPARPPSHRHRLPLCEWTQFFWMRAKFNVFFWWMVLETLLLWLQYHAHRTMTWDKKKHCLQSASLKRKSSRQKIISRVQRRWHRRGREREEEKRKNSLKDFNLNTQILYKHIVLIFFMLLAFWAVISDSSSLNCWRRKGRKKKEKRFFLFGRWNNEHTEKMKENHGNFWRMPLTTE